MSEAKKKRKASHLPERGQDGRVLRARFCLSLLHRSNGGCGAAPGGDRGGLS